MRTTQLSWNQHYLGIHIVSRPVLDQMKARVFVSEVHYIRVPVVSMADACRVYIEMHGHHARYTKLLCLC